MSLQYARQQGCFAGKAPEGRLDKVLRRTKGAWKLVYIYRLSNKPEGQNIDVLGPKRSHAPKNMKNWEHAHQHAQ